MTWADYIGAIGGFLAIVVVPIIVAYLARQGNAEVKEAENEAAEILATTPTYEAMAAHVDRMQSRLERNEAKLDALRDAFEASEALKFTYLQYMRRMLGVWPPGLPLPEPVPVWLDVSITAPTPSPPPPAEEGEP